MRAILALSLSHPIHFTPSSCYKMASSAVARTLLSSFASASAAPSQRILSRQFCSTCRSALSRSSKITIDSLQQSPSRPIQRSLIQRRFNSNTSSSTTTSSSSSSSWSSSSSASRQEASRKAYYAQRNRSLLLYTSAVLVLGVGVTYAAVPLYRIFCSA